MAKNLPTKQKDLGLIPVSGRSPGEGTWRIPWTEEPGGLQFVRSQRVGHNWATNIYTYKVSVAEKSHDLPFASWRPRKTVTKFSMSLKASETEELTVKLSDWGQKGLGGEGDVRAACSIMPDWYSMDCSLPVSAGCRIFQARILEWAAISSFRGSSQPKIEPTFPASPALAGGFFSTEHLESQGMMCCWYTSQNPKAQELKRLRTGEDGSPKETEQTHPSSDFWFYLDPQWLDDTHSHWWGRIIFSLLI